MSGLVEWRGLCQPQVEQIRRIFSGAEVGGLLRVGAIFFKHVPKIVTQSFGMLSGGVALSSITL